MKLATRKKIELKLLVPVSPMSVAYAITATDHETSALLPSPGTPGSVVSEALERVCEGDYEEGTERVFISHGIPRVSLIFLTSYLGPNEDSRI
jgi:hypothetical protein